MSADSPHRSRTLTKQNSAPTTVSPQHVTDPTILDSVAGFINDVVPAAYNMPCDTKDQIQWAHFEQLDYDESTFSIRYDCDKSIPSPLILVLGYTNGIQVWGIPANGEAVEMLSWRHGNVRVLKFLPTPYVVGCNGTVDAYGAKRPLIALCDSSAPGPHNCSLSFISLRGGEQVKLIKFKNPILDVLANSRSVVVTFSEKIAIFDAFTLEDRLTVTTCYISPGINANPVALGTRWMAYAEHKFLPARRSSGGNEGEGVQSYTATMLHAAKSLGRGLRELGETVASSLTGNSNHKPGTSAGNSQGNNQTEILQKGIVTILDIESKSIDTTEKTYQPNAVIAHFMAHTEAIVCLAFDPSGQLLLTSDKRGHDFHLFRIHPHPAGSSLAAVHHLYILHRGDTSARVQDMCFSPDSRWVTVSTLRGTTHVFPVTPYGGNVGIRTHATPHVVNRMSRFHRSAGLTVDGRSNSPVSLFEMPVNSNLPYHNPRLPPFPHPTVVSPLAQIRQPLYIQNNSSGQQRQTSARQRLSSSSEENLQVALRVCSFFASPRAWLDGQTAARDVSLNKQQTKPVESLFIMSCHGSLIQYDLDPHPIGSVPKEKMCDDTAIELTVHAKAQWILQRQPHGSDIQLPLTLENLNLVAHEIPTYRHILPDHTDDQWLSQVEIVTHAGPHRRLWMGPQFTFKTYNTMSGSPLNVNDSQAIDIGRSKPVNMPLSSTHAIMIESGSVSSCEPSPKLLDTYQKNFDDVGGAGEIQLKEDLADAMLESPGVRDNGGRCVIVSVKQHTSGVAKVVNPLGTVVTVQSDDDFEVQVPEEVVIHENCDEALFRPVVASKALMLADHKTNALPITRTAIVESPSFVNHTGNRVQNRVSTITSCTGKISTKEASPETRMEEASIKKSQKKISISDINKSKSRNNIISNKEDFDKELCKSKSRICDFSDIPDAFSKSIDYLTETDSFAKAMVTIHPSELPLNSSNYENPDLKSSYMLGDANCILNQKERSEVSAWSQIDYEYKFDEETEKKMSKEMFENEDVFAKYQDLVKPEEKVEEKQIQKKSRKAKTKLGIRLTVVNKDLDSLDTKNVEEIESVVEAAPVERKSWSSIASSKSKLDSTRKEKSNEMNTTNSLFEMDADLDILVNCNTEETNILQLDKSDDEKQENNSSETTESSDDSSKIPTQLVAMDTEEDNCQSEMVKTSLQNSTKSGKKKPKKKRR